jgi:putative tryptophan/tyrosine transport system substrate-binding protein
MSFQQMNRRDLFALLGATAAWPLRAEAQTSNLPTIGFLSTGRPPGLTGSAFRLADTSNDCDASQATLFEAYIDAFKDGLRAQGYVDGRSAAIAYRWAEGRADQLDVGASDLARLQVKLIVASGGLVSARAAMKAAPQTPILFVSGFDPVKLGLAASFNRPGGNATGASVISTELVPKRLELLHMLGPQVQNAAVLLSPQSVTPDIEAKEAMAAAEVKGYRLRFLSATTAGEIEAAVASAVEQQVNALLVTASPFFSAQSCLIVQLAARHSLPVMYPWREYVALGGLVSYGPDLRWGYRLVGEYAGRILRGEKAGDLPIQQPTKFNLVFNPKTARALGLEVSPRLLALVDEEI